MRRPAPCQDYRLLHAPKFEGGTHSSDGLHLNDLGYAGLFNRIERLLAEHDASPGSPKTT